MLLQSISEKLLPVLSSSIFIVWGLTLRSLIQVEFIFEYGVRKGSTFIPLHVAVQFFPALFIYVCMCVCVCVCVYVCMYDYFERDRDSTSRGGAERGRQNPKLAWHHQHRA